MANIKSAKKRIKVIQTKTLRNRIIKSKVKTAMKKVVLAVENGNLEDAKIALSKAAAEIDKAASKGVFHKNTAARKKASLAKLVNKMGA
ncbi:MAG: small subunit ribosomal protein [Epulopiscium sp.]|jgi:small subunit ribosomal protein S20|uniref:Small ribosomal subunit protein bS20 n=1 Tax=Defluviitalea raffinosedens TaxID=1450156 RepID=A0A7C8LJV1_9FIRM|nr:30S ribosomal protein S20 [Defluviitalea raffinosedens]MBZ4669693.1 rpsT [Defluviitaleaceae bacterium]MDK2789191.1 small subunit ribosomal protein [Candidatus Epulonipiscium sp.]KAE9637282.1 30S ribosomal protein S20 [Defluviitalea raffinosedens]MBM7685585.1 small subunit ribosomal protein S20 [Defluviitalea raffinosedens]HHW66686.1 30S ribosomal protein S20 [Candidatus Epulonipiscium sp.]